MNIKMSPLILFLILLSVLVISALFNYKSQFDGFKNAIEESDLKFVVKYCINNNFKLSDVINKFNDINSYYTTRNKAGLERLCLSNTTICGLFGQYVYIDGQPLSVLIDDITNEWNTQINNKVTPSSVTPSSVTPSSSDLTIDYTKLTLDEIITNYYINNQPNTVNTFSKEYILKTQIIPPICPGNNTNLSKSIDKLDNRLNNIDKDFKSVGSALQDGISTVGKDISAISGAAQSAASTIGKDILAIGGAAQSAASTVGKDISAIGGAVHDAASTVGKDISAIGGAVHDAASTVGKDISAIGGAITHMNPTNVNGTNNNSDSTIKVPERDSYYNSYRGPRDQSTGNPTSYTSVIDPYSYNGTLQSKGGNFIPVTSDFSKFGR